MALPPALAPLRSFRQPALQHAALWRVALVILGFELAFSATPRILRPLVDWRWPDALLTTLDYAGFCIALAVLLGLVSLLHHRGWRSLMGPLPALWRDLLKVLAAVCLVLLVQQPFDLGPDLADLSVAPLAPWLIWLVPAVLAITLQVTTEEVYFRGYLTQQLAAISTRRRIWMLLPSVYFGTSHLLNGDGLADGVLWAIWAGLLGAACADLTARTGNLGAAIGLHLGNNLFAALLLGVAGSPGAGLALLLLPDLGPLPAPAGAEALLTGAAALDLAYAILSVLVLWLAARVAIRA